MRSVVFCGLTDGDADGQTYGYRETHLPPVVEAEQPEDEERCTDDKHRTQIGTQGQSAEQVFHLGIFLGVNGKDTYEREHNTYGSYQHRGDDGAELHLYVAAYHVSGSAEGCCGQDRAAITFVEVGTHTGYVAHVVAYVVGDGGRVARVVFGNVGFHFTYEVGTHVGGLGIDTSTHTGKQRLRRSTHSEGQHGRGDHAELSCGRGGLRQESVEQKIPERDIEKTEAHNDQAHHSAGAECDAQTAVERLACGVSRTG